MCQTLTFFASKFLFFLNLFGWGQISYSDPYAHNLMMHSFYFLLPFQHQFHDPH